MAIEVPHIVVFAAGDGGTTAEALIHAIQAGQLPALVTDVIYNNPPRGEYDPNHIAFRVARLNRQYQNYGAFAGHVIRTHYISNKTHPAGPAGKGELTDEASKAMSDVMVRAGANAGALLGFRQKIRGPLLVDWEELLTNNHPGRTDEPKLRGLYGHAVHEKAHELAAAGEIDHTGFTMHLVNEVYDEGRVIDMVPVPIDPRDTADDIATNVQATERVHTPKMLGLFLAQIA